VLPSPNGWKYVKMLCAGKICENLKINNVICNLSKVILKGKINGILTTSHR
jgi:hypothetical protein